MKILATLTQLIYLLTWRTLRFLKKWNVFITVQNVFNMLASSMLISLTVVESNKRCKQIRELVITESQNKPLSVLQLLMNAAKLELKLREVEV